MLFGFIKKIITLAVLSWVLGFVYFVSLLPKHQTDDEDIVTDAAIVLTGGKNRIEEGGRLLRDKKTKKLLITGVGGYTSDREILSRLGRVSGRNVHLGREAKSTRGNALEA